MRNFAVVVAALTSIGTMGAQSEDMENASIQGLLSPEISKYAYATLLCDPSEEDQAEYIRMLLVLQESIRRFDNDNDIVTMVYGSINEEQWELLDQEGFKVVQVDNVGAMVSDPEPLRVPDDVSACYRSKLNALKLTEYERVIFIDNDMLVKQDLRPMFEADGFLAFEGSESPLNAGLFAFDPSNDAFAEIEDIMISDSFDPQNGWLGFGPFPHWKLDGYMSDWSFWCAHTDQGILYYYFDKLDKSATLLPMEESFNIVHHFTGLRKPVLHSRQQLKDVGGMKTEEDAYAEWYGLWDRVQSRLESLGKDHPTLQEQITSSANAVESRVRRVLGGSDPY